MEFAAYGLYGKTLGISEGRLMSAQGTVKEGRKLISSLSGFPAGIGWNFVIAVARFYAGPPVKKYDNTIDLCVISDDDLCARKFGGSFGGHPLKLAKFFATHGI